MTNAVSSIQQKLASQAVSQIQQKLPSVSLKGTKKLISDAQYFNSTTKGETLITQLNSNSMSAKLEAMKKVIARLSKGKDVSEFFPEVVKNVACPSLEVKKLVYLYVIHYAEEKHDEALLSIAHFQKDMTDVSPHVRALSLRVLSSIRVPIIVQIVLLAIKKCMGDPSPWVRKAAALAVPKIYNLNSDEKPQLVEIIDKLLGDSSPAVYGAVAHAYNCVCPERHDIIHKHYRRLVGGLSDVDEWGQVVLLDLLLRYARTQFLSPFRDGYKKKVNFYAEDDTESDSELIEYDMDPDHRLLLTNTLPLLSSLNHAVVIAVASLYLHLAPPAEFSSKIGLALLRILRTSRERQYVALLVIHSLASERPAAFRPFIKQFFVTPADPAFTQHMKIDILALLADCTNVPTILQEFKVYLHNAPEELLLSTVRALGRVAYHNTDVSDTCLSTLIELTSHPNELVVGEAIVVTRHLLQKITTGQGKVVIRLSRLLETLQLPSARAAVVWLLGEYLKIPQVALAAPDTYRLLLKGFATEDVAVKLQIVIFGSKLMLQEYEEEGVSEKLESLFRYMMELVNYDESYSLRDRARIISKILLDDSFPELKDRARRIFVIAKKEADFADPGEDRLRFQTGSMSHVLNSAVPGYLPLSDFPSKQPDPSVRNLTMDYSTTTESDGSSGSSSSGSFFSSDETSQSESEDASSTESSDEESEPVRKSKPKKKPQKATKKKPVSSSEESTEESSDESESESESSSEPKKKPKRVVAAPVKKTEPKKSGGSDLLQFMGDFTAGENSPTSEQSPKKQTIAPDPLASAWGIGMAEISSPPPTASPRHQVPQKVHKFETDSSWISMLKSSSTHLKAEYAFPVEKSEYDGMTLIAIKISNNSSEDLSSISFGNEISDVSVIPFTTIPLIAANQTFETELHVNWGEDSDSEDDSSVNQPIEFSITISGKEYPSLVPPRA